MVISPEISSRVPAAGSQPKVYFTPDSGFPAWVMMFSPGHWKATEPLLSRLLTNPICAIEKTAMITM